MTWGLGVLEGGPFPLELVMLLPLMSFLNACSSFSLFFHHASSAVKASAVAAAEDRALEAEVARFMGMTTMTTLWDLKKFFDSINIRVLVELAMELGFPVKQLAFSLVVHQAPRRLKLGTAVGEVIQELGRYWRGANVRLTWPEY